MGIPAGVTLIVGGGYIGLETAEQFRRRGLEVALVEMQPQVLPLHDPEMVEPLHRQLQPLFGEPPLQVERGHATFENDRLCLTDSGFLVADRVAREFLGLLS